MFPLTRTSHRRLLTVFSVAVAGVLLTAPQAIAGPADEAPAEAPMCTTVSAETHAASINGAATTFTWNADGVSWNATGAEADHFKVTVYYTDGTTDTIWGTSGSAAGSVGYVDACHCPGHSPADHRTERGRRGENRDRERPPVETPPTEVPPVDDPTPVDPTPEPITDPAPVDPTPEPITDPAPIDPTPEPITDPAPVEPPTEVAPVPVEDAYTGTDGGTANQDASTKIVPARQLRPGTEVTEVASSSTRIVAPAVDVLGASANQPSVTETKVLADTLPMTGIGTSDLSLIAAALMTLGGTLLGVTRRKNVSPIA